MIEYKIRTDQFGLVWHDTQFITTQGRYAFTFFQDIIRTEVGKVMASAISDREEMHYKPIAAITTAKMACDMAEALWAEMVRREMVIEGPTVAQLETALEA